MILYASATAKFVYDMLNTNHGFVQLSMSRQNFVKA